MKNNDDRFELDNEENPFALSTGDLMAGLMFIFVLLLSYMMLNVQKKAAFTFFSFNVSRISAVRF